MKKIIGKALIVLLLIGIMAGAVYGLMVLLGVNTIAGLREVVNGYGFWAYGIIVLLQVIQVIFIPVSNQIITIPAIAVIGVIPAFICSWIGIEIGTITLYFIGRKGGGKLLSWLLADKEKAEKFGNLVKTRKLFYITGMLLPFIPNDLLSVLAGTCKINFLYVIIVSFFTRGICTLFTCIGFGILTKVWWGILILVLGIILLAIATVLSYKYGDKIEKWIFKKKSITYTNTKIE